MATASFTNPLRSMAAAGAAMAMGCRFAGVCSVSGRAEGARAPAAARAPRGAVRLGSRPMTSNIRQKSIGAQAKMIRTSGGVCVATLMEQPNTYQRRPEDVVASNGREVEQLALQACVKRQLSGGSTPKPQIPQEMLDSAYERCREVTGEYAKTFYLGARPPLTSTPAAASRLPPHCLPPLPPRCLPIASLR